ncbi:uncharacterized protein LOC129768910 [Toxorhynchites rutilus septentrionalis]|uniref:uncharacterized protein LOC129768910 n=1 Tax=Toxorhynchites rutilus septentrionalis TaxID=329112 RepID=UPI00247A34D0|nr:uncharacterized protein LOC129768910 [Toxorhynchites rutilus septentrionalis]
MGENNYLSAYKLINSQLVLSNQKLKEEIKEKIEMINEINEELFKYREENKTLRDMVQKLVEQFKTITTIMVSVRDQSESVLNVVFKQHSSRETEQQTRKPIAALIYQKHRAECPPYVDEAAIAEAEDEDHSMEDYRTALNVEDEDNDDDEFETDQVLSFNSLPKSPLIRRLGRKSRNRSFDESFETIDTNRVIKAARRSQEYLSGRESKDSKDSEDDTGGIENMDISQTVIETNHIAEAQPSIVSEEMEADNSLTLRNTRVEDYSSTMPSDRSALSERDTTSDHDAEPLAPKFEASSFSEHSSAPSDHSIQSELNPPTDQSLRPVLMKRMASDSMLSTIVDRETNKENTIINDTISNATCSTPLSKQRKGKLKNANQHLPPISPVPLVRLKPLTKENLSQHNISYESLFGKEDKSLKQEELDRSDQTSLESSDSKRPRRRAAPKTLKEPSLTRKLRRT